MADLVGKPKIPEKKHKYQKIYDDIPEIIASYNDPDKWFGYIMPDKATARRARITAEGYLFTKRYKSELFLQLRGSIEEKEGQIILWLHAYENWIMPEEEINNVRPA